MKRNFSSSDQTEFIEVSNDDVKKYKTSSFIQKNLLDLQYSGNLDDERVLVYIQPIFDIKVKAFRTGEALMRMKIGDKKSKDLLQLLLQHFKKSGFSTVIEGVEDLEQKEYCEKIGFDYIQGYYFSKPVPACEVDNFYDTKHSI